MIAGILAGLRTLVSMRAVILYGSIAVAIIATGTWYTVHWFNTGYAKAISDIAHENKEATDAANALKAKRRACRGSWDQSLGMCVYK